MTDTSKDAVERLDTELQRPKHEITLADRCLIARTLRALLAERDEAVTIGQVMAQRAGELKVERDAIAAVVFEVAVDFLDDAMTIEGARRVIRALTPADAINHLKAIKAKAEARGMREAAELARHGHHPRAILDLAAEREKGTGHD